MYYHIVYSEDGLETLTVVDRPIVVVVLVWYTGKSVRGGWHGSNAKSRDVSYGANNNNKSWPVYLFTGVVYCLALDNLITRRPI